MWINSPFKKVADEPEGEIEDDVAEMVRHMAIDAVEDGLGTGNGSTEVTKQQFRDALAKFVDARIAAALKQGRP